MLIDALELDNTSPNSFLRKYMKSFKRAAIEDPDSVPSKVVAQLIFQKGLLDDIDKQMSKTLATNRDFQLYRIRRLAFSKQQRVLDSKSRSKGIMAGRRSGKTEVNVFEALQKQIDRPGARVVVIGLTIMKTIEIYWDRIVKYLDELDYAYEVDNELHKIILSDTGGVIQFGGNANKAEREKYLGQYWDLIIVDEAQSQPGLKYFIESVLKPMLIDTRGELMLTGTGARTPGTYWEEFYNDDSGDNFRINWNAGDNEILQERYGGIDVLKAIRDEMNYDEESAIYKREILGLSVYDTDALVFRMDARHKYTDAEFLAWKAKQNPNDIRFTAGLDWGFSDAAGFVIICYSGTSNLRWVVYEHKAYGQAPSELAPEVKKGINYVTTDPIFEGLPYRAFNIYCDDSRPDLIREFRTVYGLTVIPATRADKDGLVSNVRRDARKMWIRVREGSELYEESQRTVFERSEQNGLPLNFVTGIIDDSVYHPDVMFAYGYGIRSEIWEMFGEGLPYETDQEWLPPAEQTLDQQLTEHVLNNFGSV